jgi:hypothetical protein
MRIGMRGILAICAVASFAQFAMGQNLAQSQGTVGSGAATRSSFHPYTAHFKTTTVQTLANGVTITRETTEIRAMDAQGRYYSAMTTPAAEQMPEHKMMTVSDPADGTTITWMSPGKSATVRKMPPQSQWGCWSTGVVQASSDAMPANEHVKDALNASSAPAQSRAYERESEDLGTQTIQGVVAHGRRTTDTIPTGAVGNDAPLIRTSEAWNSKTVPFMVRSITDDPRTGKTTRELVEFSQSDPDPALFQPPEGYQIVTQEMHQVPCAQ